MTHEAVQRFANRLRDEGKSPGTIRKVHGTLSAAMTEGVRLGIVRVNPCHHVRLPRVEHREMLSLTPTELSSLADAIDPRYRTLVFTAGYCGLRASELWALRRKRVDLLRGRIHVAEAVTDVNGHLSFGPPKTSHSRRTVSIPKFLRAMLEEQFVAAPGSGEGREALVFPSPQGATMQQRLFYGRYFRPAVTAAVEAGDLPPEKAGFRFHDLRHTCAALLIAQGAHAKAIKERLGHESIVITLDRYGHLLPALDDELADALDATYARVRLGATAPMWE